MHGQTSFCAAAGRVGVGSLNTLTNPACHFQQACSPGPALWETRRKVKAEIPCGVDRGMVCWAGFAFPAGATAVLTNEVRCQVCEQACIYEGTKHRGSLPKPPRGTSDGHRGSQTQWLPSVLSPCPCLSAARRFARDW